MSVICPKCGYELPDGAKFCGSCGTNLAALKRTAGNICTNCGSQLKEGAKFCNVCGTKVMSAAQEEPKPEVKPEQPTMEELVPPVITDDTFAGQGQTSVKHEGDPDFDSILPPGAEPAETAAVQQPTEQEIKTAQQNDNFSFVTPSSAETPVINDSYYNGGIKTEEKPQPMPVQNTSYSQDPAASAAANNTAGAQNTQPGNYGNVPNHQPYPDPVQQNVTPGKSPSVLIPVILIILILAVIAVDVFVLFPDRIFGEKNESSSEKEVAAVTYFLEE